MLGVLIRVSIIYLIAIVIMRFMGKRQIGEMEPFELVITLIIADLATIPMSDPTIPIWYGVIPLIIMAVIHYIFSQITKIPKVRDILSGKPAIVITPDGIDFKVLKSLDISCEELLELLRNTNFFDIGDINYAILERTGKMTVIPKSRAVPATRGDQQIVKPESEVFYTIIENGKVIPKNLPSAKLNKEILLRHLGQQDLTEKKIGFLVLSDGGSGYIQKRGEIGLKEFKLFKSEGGK
ncbi:MAG: DUF421 domain-containing protein [Christensenellaceae bacterium]|jgi:uncharacterized membrane protein YcaP (DUF421 family)|nr:DUF421 domain-containing protein [Christensenellaceae bacterium]